MKVALVATRAILAIGVTLALVAGLSAPMNRALAADTPEVQQKKGAIDFAS